MFRWSMPNLKNEKLLGLLNDLHALARADRQRFRALSIRQAINIVQMSVELKTAEQVKKIKVGDRMQKRLQEFVQTGTFSDMKELQRKPGMTEYIRFTKVPYIDKELAAHAAFVKKLKNVEDLISLPLNRIQKLYVKYHKDIEKSIPRDETTVMLSRLQSIVHNTVSEDIRVIGCGSYRRKHPVSRDIDVLLTSNKNCLEECIKALAKHGFIIETAREGERVFSGFCRFDPDYLISNGKDLTAAEQKPLRNRDEHPVRRIDIRWMESAALWPAVVYFTGSKAFNFKMRLAAIEKGMRLNEYGIFRTANKREKPLYASSEREVFDLIGMPYVKPEKRSL